MRSEEPQHGKGGMFCIDTTARNKTKCSVVYSANQKDMLSNENSFLPNYAYYMQAEIGHLKKKNTVTLFVCLLKLCCLSIVSSFPFHLQWSQEKMKTMLMQNCGGETRSIMVFLKVAYALIATW